MARSILGFAGTVPVDVGALRDMIPREMRIPAQAVSGAAPSVEFPLGTLTGKWPAGPFPAFTAKFIPMTDTAKSTTDYWTISIMNRYADGTGTDVLASLTTNAASGTLSKYIAAALTIATNVRLPQLGDVLTIVVAQTGSTGKAVPDGLIIFGFSEAGGVG